ncbi:hypothetical protein GARC_2898 [Paraglaciecola arctica BSs20135]|uniref:Uncharacterized protein n=1 Tax=Paraglaciecola arctica BSs20135 TaxID=493475 RepID=K6Y7F8_9ALTE|nr:hypothetical protein GARC_2898 [Paraglaciecola arctica BSs20135]
MRLSSSTRICESGDDIVCSEITKYQRHHTDHIANLHK